MHTARFSMIKLIVTDEPEGRDWIGPAPMFCFFQLVIAGLKCYQKVRTCRCYQRETIFEEKWAPVWTTPNRSLQEGRMGGFGIILYPGSSGPLLLYMLDGVSNPIWQRGLM